MLTLGVTFNPLSKLLAIHTQNEMRHCLGLDSTVAYFRHHADIYTALHEKVIQFFPLGLEYLPTQLPQGVAIAALCERIQVGMELVRRRESTDNGEVLNLKKNATVWVDNLNYKTQLLDFNPNIKVNCFRYEPLEAIAEMRAGNLDACLMSKVIVIGLNVGDTEFELTYFSPKELIPMPAQGVKAFLVASNDTETKQILKKMHNPNTAFVTNVERRLKQLFEDKDTVAAYCEIDKEGIYHLWAAICKPNGQLQRVRLSQSTHYELAERAYEQLTAEKITS
jgi:hydroxymethylbilane synthase